MSHLRGPTIGFVRTAAAVGCVGLVVSVLVAVPSLMGGGVPGLAGIVAAALFAVAWRGCERLRRQRRLEWGVRQRRILGRQAQLHRRRDALRNAPVTDQGSGPPGTTESF